MKIVEDTTSVTTLIVNAIEAKFWVITQETIDSSKSHTQKVVARKITWKKISAIIIYNLRCSIRLPY